MKINSCGAESVMIGIYSWLLLWSPFCVACSVVVGLYNCRPPRCMGDGFVLLQSSDIDIYYYQDEPGVYMFALQQFV